MVNFTRTNQTFTAPDWIGPNESASAIAQLGATQATLTLSLTPAEQGDTTLSIRIACDWTDDPAGVANWQELMGNDWSGGRHEKNNVGLPLIPPTLGPLTMTQLPPTMQFVRPHLKPSRTLPGESYTITVV